MPDPQTEFALLRESLGVSRINHILRVHGHTILQEKRATEIYDEVGQRSLERHFPRFTEDSTEQATLSASESGMGYKRAQDITSPAHLGAFIAATPRILAMTQDAVMAGLLPKQPLVTCLAAMIEAATTTYLAAHHDEHRATAKLFVQRTAWAGDEAWQQTVEGHNGPTVTNPTVSEIEQSSSASQDDDDDDVEFIPAPRKSRLSAPQLQAQLPRLSGRTEGFEEHTRLQGCVAASDEN